MKNIKTKNLLAITLICFIITSCNKTTDKNIIEPSSLATIEVGLQSATFNETKTLDKQLSTKNKVHTEVALAQTSTISLNNELQLIAEFTPIQEASKLKKFAATRNNSTNLINPLNLQTRYKLLVYNTDGSYVTEKNYRHGNETAEGKLQLDGGKSYIFIAYSINSKTELPEVAYTAYNKTLSSAQIMVSGTTDLMYFKKEMKVSGETTNYLGVTLKHQLSQITTTIDASETGYDITSITSSIGNSYPRLTINLADAMPTYTGTATQASVEFPTVHQQIVTSTPTYINATTNTGTYNIASISVGPTTETNLTPFTKLNIIPGVKYNMKVKISPKNDYYLIWQSQLAVKIGDQIWMRHNLGANTSLSPDDEANAIQMNGHYYQWGKDKPSASGTSDKIQSNWNGYEANAPANTAWNAGSENNPQKGYYDPCPAGYRVPTITELNILLTKLVYTTKGNWNNNPYDETYFTSQKMLKSKKNSHVQFMVPAQGYFYFEGNGFPFYNTDIKDRATIASFWSSTILQNGTSGLGSEKVGITIFNHANSTSSKLLSHPIRCIAI